MIRTVQLRVTVTEGDDEFWEEGPSALDVRKVISEALDASGFDTKVEILKYIEDWEG